MLKLVEPVYCFIHSFLVTLNSKDKSNFHISQLKSPSNYKNHDFFCKNVNLWVIFWSFSVFQCSVVDFILFFIMTFIIHFYTRCQTIILQWFHDGTLFSRLFIWLLAVNILVYCIYMILRHLVTIFLLRWPEWWQIFKGRDYIYNLEECPICFQDFCDPIRLPCGHVNCLKCITDYCRHMQHCGGILRCSLCRAPIRDILYLEVWLCFV